MKIYRQARGKDHKVALQRAENIGYESLLTSDSILFDSTLRCQLTDMFRDQEVEVDLFIPIGHTVYFDEATRSIWRYIETEDDDLRIRELMGKRWTMGEEGLYDAERKPRVMPNAAPKKEPAGSDTDSTIMPDARAI